MNEKKKQCLSQIPDEVVCYILSKFELKEAARTSVIARGWKYLWSYSVTNLNFDASRKLPRLEKELEKDETAWYVSWVNEVLELLRVPTIEHFRVQFYLDKSCADDIDRWLRYAFEKRVKRLELDFSSVFSYYGKGLYPFPDISNPVERMRIFPSGLWTLTTLDSLSLKAVQVSNQVLEFFISNCPLLEQLCLEFCGKLTHLRISGSSSHLKHLKMYNCEEMTSLEINAPNLLSLEYFGPTIQETDIQVRNTKKLAKLTLYDASISMLHAFSDCITHLEELSVDHVFPPQYLHIFEDGLPRMKKIVLRVRKHYGESLLDMTRDLLDAAPHLEVLCVDLYADEPQVQRERQPSRPHKFLKVVEIIGCAGGVVDTELAMFLSRIAISLEKMVLCPRFRNYQNVVSATRQLAQELKAALPSRTQVVVI